MEQNLQTQGDTKHWLPRKAPGQHFAWPQKGKLTPFGFSTSSPIYRSIRNRTLSKDGDFGGLGRMKYTLGLTHQPPSSLHLHVAGGTPWQPVLHHYLCWANPAPTEIIRPSKCSPATEVWASATRYKALPPPRPRSKQRSGRARHR